MIKHYLWPNSTTMKLCNQKYEYVPVQEALVECI